MITNQSRRIDSDLSAWNLQADTLDVVAKLVHNLADQMPCNCGYGLCDQCTRLAWLEAELKAARDEAAAKANALAESGAFILPMARRQSIGRPEPLHAA